MPALDAPPPEAEARDPLVERHNSRLGLILFAIYLLGYGTFVLLSTFSPQSLDAVPAGMALIVGAFIISLIYMSLCKNPRVSP